MNRVFFTSVLLCAAAFCHAQIEEVAKDSLIANISDRLDVIEYRLARVDRYKLYKTENMYNLLKLDTATGKIEQLQWSLDNNKEMTMTINDIDLTYGQGGVAGVFELYPTNNMYQFILLDKLTGRSWHVQWGIGASKRWINRIY